MQTLAQLRALLPKRHDLPARPKRGILHWTGGGPVPNQTDLDHYHFVFGRDGRVWPGKHGVAANMRQLGNSDHYAGHTGGFNSFSLGFSFAGMHPEWDKEQLTQFQVERGLKFVALAFDEYQLDPADPAQLFSHFEAWTLHKVKGTQNHVKPDIRRLPFLPAMAEKDVGGWLRSTTDQYLARLRLGVDPLA